MQRSQGSRLSSDIELPVVRVDAEPAYSRGRGANPAPKLVEARRVGEVPPTGRVVVQFPAARRRLAQWSRARSSWLGQTNLSCSPAGPELGNRQASNDVWDCCHGVAVADWPLAGEISKQQRGCSARSEHSVTGVSTRWAMKRGTTGPRLATPACNTSRRRSAFCFRIAPRPRASVRLRSTRWSRARLVSASRSASSVSTRSRNGRSRGQRPAFYFGNRERSFRYARPASLPASASPPAALRNTITPYLVAGS